MSHLLTFAAALPLVLPLTLSSQQDKPVATTGTLSLSAKLVVVPSVVRDKHGALVSTLGKDDFILKVDGKAQSVRYFDLENDTPLTLGLLVDTSHSQSAVLDDERSASTKFLQRMLEPATATRASDKAFVIQFARDIELLQDVTDSRPKLQEALKLVDSESPSFRKAQDDRSNDRDDGRGSDRRAGYEHGGFGGTALYDAAFLATDEVTAKQKGRRALILLTDGVDRGSKKTLAGAIEAAQRADTILYAIYFKGEQHRDSGFGGPGGGHRGGGFPGGGGGYPGGGYPGGGGGGQRRGGYDNNVDGKKILERMCGETGGRVFEVKGKETVDAIYTEIGNELRAQYRLGFTPSSDAAANGYHQIDLELSGAQAKNKLTVQTRDGYYTGAD